MDKEDVFFARYILWFFVCSVVAVMFISTSQTNIELIISKVYFFLYLGAIIFPGVIHYRKEIGNLFRVWLRYIIGKEVKDVE